VKNAAQARRLLAIAAALDGSSRERAAKIGGMDRQTLRDWVIRFNEQGPDGLVNKSSPGAPGKLNDKHKAFLAGLVEAGPIPAVDGVVRWRACDLTHAGTYGSSHRTAAAAGTRPRDLSAGAIQRELLRQGVYLSPAVEACFFKQSLSEAFLPDARIVALLQRLLSRHLTAKDITDGSTTLRDPFHNSLCETRREIVDGGVSITVGENPYYVAMSRRRPFKKLEK